MPIPAKGPSPRLLFSTVLTLAVIAACAPKPPETSPHSAAAAASTPATASAAAPEPAAVAAPASVFESGAAAGSASANAPAPAMSRCVTGRAPRIRRGGDLLVESPPRAPARSVHLRMRTHVEGMLTTGNERVWVGPEVPPFMLIVGGTRELFLLDEAPDGFFGFYRDPYNASSCQLRKPDNCSFGVALFDCTGQRRFIFLLNPLFSRPDQLEVQDIHYVDGVVYFNEACQSYAREAGGKCSSLVAVEPMTQTVLWRTPPLISNNVFLVHQRYLITGHGFTDEPDFLFVVRRADGKVMQKLPVPHAHEALSLDAEGTLTASLEHDEVLLFRAEGFDTDLPRLSPIGKKGTGTEKKRR